VAITFRSKYPISRTMVFEREYHKNLRLTLPEKRDLLRRAIVIWMFEGGKLVGETYGISLDGADDLPGCPRDRRSIYCYSNTILGKYKGKGYGSLLKAAFIGRVSRDFRRIYGHARPGASQALNRKFGARFLSTHRNWFQTGEDYRLYVLPLDGPSRPGRRRIRHEARHLAYPKLQLIHAARRPRKRRTTETRRKKLGSYR
jgi:hypothetical protein